MKIRNILAIGLLFTLNGLASGQTYERLVSSSPGRLVELQPRTTYHPGGYRTAGAGYGGYAYPGNAAAYPPVVPIASPPVAAGGCYGNNRYAGYPTNYPVATSTGYPSTYPTSYPYWTGYPHGRHGGGHCGNRYGDQFVGRNLFGAPTRFDRDEPVRNIFRWLLP